MNTLELGLKLEPEIFFKGDYRSKMSELRKAGFIPLSTEDVMDARNEVPAEHPYWHNYIDTDFGIAGTKKKIYLAPHSARLRTVDPDTKLTRYGLTLKVDALETMQAYVRKDHNLGQDLTEEEARGSRIWLAFAAGDQNRLDKYVENTFRFGKDQFKHGKMMGIFILEDQKPIERAVMLNRLDFRSLASGHDRLMNGACFVGASKWQYTAQKSQ